LCKDSWNIFLEEAKYLRRSFTCFATKSIRRF
jgi:hypothetical protein